MNWKKSMEPPKKITVPIIKNMKQKAAESYKKLENLRVLILDALRIKEHPTHFSLAEAVEEARKIAAQETYFVHMSHNINHEEHQKSLPENIYFAYDGLKLKLG